MPIEAGGAVRRADAHALAAALQVSRADTLATFAVFELALPGLRVPQVATLNPPLWELGHIGWFQEYWIARNAQRALGVRADPTLARPHGVRAQADALYDSSRVAHDARWTLALPDADATHADLEAQLATTLALLRGTADDDDALYFFRLALLHEDMHHEAALYSAQALGIAVADPRWQAAPLGPPGDLLHLDAGPWRLGHAGPGFVFDNEAQPHEVALPATRIDRQVLRWADFLPFVEAGGYAQPQWWSDAGAAWLAATGATAPRYTREGDAGWQAWRHGTWRSLELAHAACYLNAHEAEAWCRWTGRRLPTEAEWERAAVARPDEFTWGEVWEWTASGFAPYPGFAPHPYRDYSAPWFGSRRVLRGASFMTQPRMYHPRYRNFFEPHRNDIAAGFRTCER